MQHSVRMRYLSNTADQRAEMLETIGVSDAEAFLERIPAKARLGRDLTVPPALAESELVAHVRALAESNAHAADYACFLGAGAYDHYVPSVINHLLLRSEFYRLHAVSARGQPGDAPLDLRVSDDDLRAHRDGRHQCLDL